MVVIEAEIWSSRSSKAQLNYFTLSHCTWQKLKVTWFSEHLSLKNIFVLDIVDQHPKWYIPTSLAECKFQRKWCGELVAPREAGHQARGTNSGLFSQMDLLIMRNRLNWLNQSGQKLGQGRKLQKLWCGPWFNDWQFNTSTLGSGDKRFREVLRIPSMNSPILQSYYPNW